MVKYVKIVEEVRKFKGNSIEYFYGGLDLNKVRNPIFVGDLCYAEVEADTELTHCCELITEQVYLDISKQEFDNLTVKNETMEEKLMKLTQENTQLKQKQDLIQKALDDLIMGGM